MHVVDSVSIPGDGRQRRPGMEVEGVHIGIGNHNLFKNAIQIKVCGSKTFHSKTRPCNLSFITRILLTFQDMVSVL